MSKTRKNIKGSKNYVLINETAKTKTKTKTKTKKKSFSPSVNKKINLKNKSPIIDLFSCKKNLPNKQSYYLTKFKSKKIDATFLSKLKKFIYGLEINVDLKKTICNNLVHS